MAKVLCSMDLSDPMLMRVKIDHFAIRSGSFRWFVRYCESNFHDSRFFLPNILYSYALARHLLDASPSSASSSSSSPSPSPSSSPSPSPDSSLETTLQSPIFRAIAAFPAVICELASSMNHDPLTCLLSTHPHFTSSPPPPALKNLISIYVTLSCDFFKAPEVQEWLTSSVQAACEALSANPQLPDTILKSLAATYGGDGGEQSVLGSRPLAVADYVDSEEQLPAEAFEGGVGGMMGGGGGGGMMMGGGEGGDFDMAALGEMLQQGMVMEGGGMGGGGGAHPGFIPEEAPEAVQNNPLLMFLWSLAPWNLNVEPEEEVPHDEDYFFDDDEFE